MAHKQAVSVRDGRRAGRQAEKRYKRSSRKITSTSHVLFTQVPVGSQFSRVWEREGQMSSRVRGAVAAVTPPRRRRAAAKSEVAEPFEERGAGGSPDFQRPSLIKSPMEF
ncbi:hypothetical protein SKAU_G00394820 [Synaphobranchus kaupii]|uniref:Uncharacterized protein n=1 Tax=Synaphobranchus kaupii TaxID=118154 RepID=A0A9Q1EC75_SYNKA|nr:hypothetical protein SKAU_G00394820 [Synaphobranchus kaupii]